MKNLPIELLFEIFLFCDEKTILSLLLVNKKWNFIINNNSTIWKKICEKLKKKKELFYIIFFIYRKWNMGELELCCNSWKKVWKNSNQQQIWKIKNYHETIQVIFINKKIFI